MRPRLPLFLLLLVSLPVAAQFGPTDPADYERMLVPVSGSTPGAFGSVWTASISGYSDSGAFFVLPYCTRGLVCGYDYYLRPGIPSTFTASPDTAGDFLYVPKASANDVDLVVHVSDYMHPADSNVDVPVVRAADFRSNIRLLDVPSASNIRSMLRVYGYQTGTVTVIARGASGQQISTTTLTLTGADYVYNGFLMYPAFAGEPLSFDGQNDVMLDITSDSGSPIWAFVSVTNNDTQHINLIVPFRKN